MGVNEVRIVVMVVSFFLFLGVVCWAYAPKRRGLLESVGRGIVDDDETATKIGAAERSAL